MAIKRSTAYRIRLKNIVNSPYEKREGFNPSVIKFNNLEISRVNVIASIVGKYLTDDQNYCAITLDDGSETIRVKNFGAEVGVIKELNVGDIVRIIGKIKEYNEEKYIAGEISKVLNPNWLIVNEIELSNQKQTETDTSTTDSINKVIETKTNSSENEEIISISSESSDSESSIKQKILQYLKNNDNGTGVIMDQIMTSLDVSSEEVKDSLYELLKVGEIYEPKKGILKILD
jgi:RPA family protein